MAFIISFLEEQLNNNPALENVNTDLVHNL